VWSRRYKSSTKNLAKVSKDSAIQESYLFSTMTPTTLRLLTLLGLAAAAPLASQAEDTKPLKVMLVLGGCCHDYGTQKMLLAEGISARANVEFQIEHNPDKSTKVTYEFYKNPDWAKGFDLIIHDECAADVVEQGYVSNILNAHKSGVPAVNLHCAMHCYRWGNFRDRALKIGDDNAGWYEFTGIQSTGHGPQEPIKITFTDTQHPITKTLSGWTTIKEELYNNIQIFPTSHELAKGDQEVTDKKTQAKRTDTAVIAGTKKYVPSKTHELATGDQEVTDKKTQAKRTDTAVIAWTNEYGPSKTRVFNTTLGHNNETVGDARYLDFLTRGVLWATGKLGEDGKPVAGYGPKQK
jgi:type 1 glutamine amidotransferase